MAGANEVAALKTARAVIEDAVAAVTVNRILVVALARAAVGRLKSNRASRRLINLQLVSSRKMLQINRKILHSLVISLAVAVAAAVAIALKVVNQKLLM